MRILISTKFYYHKGGACIHASELEKLLKSKGHEVAFFAMQHPLNKPSDYSAYFPSEVDYSKRNLQNLKEQLLRPLFSYEVKRKFKALLHDFKPDLVHVHNIHSQLSPIIVKEAWKVKIPVVWTLHDYKLLCPRYDCQRNDKPCELCFTDKKNVVLYHCMKNSLPTSLLAYAEAIIWNRVKLSGYTTQFICPSEFMRQKMISGGFNKDQLTTINNFFNADKLNVVQQGKENYYCYVGRLSQEKGVETLLKAAIKLPQYHLKIIGTGPLYNYFIKRYNFPHIEFCGHKPGNEVQELLSKAVFSVIPSEWYENNPLSIIESLSMGTPVLGAEIGGIPELITENVNGFLFESGNLLDLRDKIEYFWGKGIHLIDNNEIANISGKRFSSEIYYEKLLKVYRNAKGDLDM